MNKEKIKIIQITDTHLVRDNSTVFNINTNLAFKKVIKNMQADLADTDAIFLTGDLSQDESIESYEIIVDSLKEFNNEIFWIPGNHDSITNMHQVFAKKKNFIKGNFLATHLWDFIFLNTKQDGKESGFLLDDELEFLNLELKKERNKPVALVMHHHPIEVNTPLIDKYILENKESFFAVIGQSEIDLIISGHVHHDYSINYNDIYFETSPATCCQFSKGTRELVIENYIGYKIYYFSSSNYVTETKFFAN
ncbi:metallophosphoesterase [Legionella sp. D16C41]|uniref:metallophosphoesterase n=1 Tax=Legionella sp. D16C41 TaxID=3402688 RepID=UPI003AF6F464